ncbi:MAG: phosphoglycerate dehydrogenase [Pseudorhodobacter sp.]|nr:phosphoglycerate dehydrogenase [Rhizobacter sp.]
MDILIVEPIEDDIVRWLEARHSVRYEPELADDPRAFRQSLYNVRALFLPPVLSLDAQTLHSAPVLRAVGRVSAGAENIDVDACAKAGVEVVRSGSATAQAEAEFVMGAMLSLLRRVPVIGSDGMRVGRELGSAQVGLIGMTPAARVLSRLLQSFGAKVSAYDPALHATDGVWERWNVQPLGLRELLETSDAVSVQLAYFRRYHGLLGERVLPFCKVDQIIVSISHSGLFDESALAEVLRSQRVVAAWFDSLEPGALDEGRPLAGINSLQVTPRVASTTRESRLRSAWAVARRLDELLSLPALPLFDSLRGGAGAVVSAGAAIPDSALRARPFAVPASSALPQANQTSDSDAAAAALSELPSATPDGAQVAAWVKAAPVAAVAVVTNAAPVAAFEALTGVPPREFKTPSEALEFDLATGPVLP